MSFQLCQLVPSFPLDNFVIMDAKHFSHPPPLLSPKTQPPYSWGTELGHWAIGWLTCPHPPLLLTLLLHLSTALLWPFLPMGCWQIELPFIMLPCFPLSSPLGVLPLMLGTWPLGPTSPLPKFAAISQSPSLCTWDTWIKQEPMFNLPNHPPHRPTPTLTPTLTPAPTWKLPTPMPYLLIYTWLLVRSSLTRPAVSPLHHYRVMPIS
jgi:hypothetical protein